MLKVFGLVLIWFVQAALIVLLISGQWIEEQSRREQSLIAVAVGASRYRQVASRSAELYRRCCVTPGFVAESYRRLLPDRSLPQKGMENLAPWFWPWLEHRLDAFWWIIYRAIFRSLLCGAWMIPILAFTGVSTADGLAKRAIMRINGIGPSSDRHRAATIALAILLFSAVLYLTLPMCIDPLVVPVWGVAFGLACRVWIGHTQHRV